MQILTLLECICVLQPNTITLLGIITTQPKKIGVKIQDLREGDQSIWMWAIVIALNQGKKKLWLLQTKCNVYSSVIMNTHFFLSIFIKCVYSVIMNITMRQLLLWR